MVFLLLIPGFLLPTVIGCLLLRLLEYRHPFLFFHERWLLGFVSGTTFAMFITFLFHVTGLIAFTFWGFLSVQLLLTLFLSLWLWRKGLRLWAEPITQISKLKTVPSWLLVIVALFTLWTILKIAGGALMLTQTPAYHDDVFNNWNFRGKVFFETHRLTLTLPIGNETFSQDGVSSYPPTVPMVKTWLAFLRGEWHEGLVNSIHILWYLSAIALLFCGLRRCVGSLWALIGVYLLSSLPLYLIHGSNAYADVFLSLHLLIPLLLLFIASQQTLPNCRVSVLRVGAFFTGLLVFTKNEALLLYLPPLLLCITLYMLWEMHHKRLTVRQAVSLMLWYLGCLASTLLPWLAFKYLHDLPFGNAKAISGFHLGWQPGVLYAIWINTFFEGNWIFLWPLCITLVMLRWRDAFRPPLLSLTLFLLIVLGEQTLLYLLTSLSEEALKQTGLARGLVHLAPLTVFVVTVLLHNTWNTVTRPSRP